MDKENQSTVNENNSVISLAHGAGGKSSEELLKLLFSKIELQATPNGIGID